MSQVLYLDEARQHTLSAGPKHMIRLIPGRNVIDDDVYEAVLDSGLNGNPSRLREMIDEGKIKVAGETVDISKMQVKNALELVELEATEEGLLDLLVQEESAKNRTTITKSIKSRMDSIEAGKNAELGDGD